MIPPRLPVWPVLFGMLSAIPAITWGDSPGCDQARSLVAETRRRLTGAEPDHESIRWALVTARRLCPSLGEAWVLSHCNAIVRGDGADAMVFANQARFLGVDLACPRASEPPSTPLPAFVRDKFALIVGIGSFRDPRIPPLRFAAKDARDLAALLTDPEVGRFHPDNVTVLTDAEATRAGILNALQEIFIRAREDDLVLLYFSSHGSPRREDGGLGGVGYLVTHDTSLDTIWLDAIDFGGLSRRAALIRARRRVIFLDTCYSGIAAAGEKALGAEAAGVDAETAALFLSGEGTYVVTSSQGDERSFESENLGNSYFTHFLLRALRRPGDAPSLREVFSVLAREVPTAVARERRAVQNPQILPANGPGDLRIGVAARHANEGTGPPRADEVPVVREENR
jgi:hypothetical protein